MKMKEDTHKEDDNLSDLIDEVEFQGLKEIELSFDLDKYMGAGISPQKRSKTHGKHRTAGTNHKRRPVADTEEARNREKTRRIL